MRYAIFWPSKNLWYAGDMRWSPYYEQTYWFYYYPCEHMVLAQYEGLEIIEDVPDDSIT